MAKSYKIGFSFDGIFIFIWNKVVHANIYENIFRSVLIDVLSLIILTPIYITLANFINKFVWFCLLHLKIKIVVVCFLASATFN